MRVFAAVGLSILLGAGPAFADCGFKRSFHRDDRAGSYIVAVYQGPPEPALGGERPLVFVTDLTTDTGSTPVSFSPADPEGLTTAVGRIRQALRPGKTVEDFRRVAEAGWPADETWTVLNPAVVERDQVTGKPCLSREGYLMPIGGLGRDAFAHDRIGDCDASKWLDGRTVPMIALPPGRTAFTARGAGLGSLTVAMTLDGPRRMAYGVAGVVGPKDELGEATIAFNRQLNGLPEEFTPGDYETAISWLHTPRSVVMVFPGDANRVGYPVHSGAAVQAAARARFDAWGGEARLFGCLAEMGV